MSGNFSYNNFLEIYQVNINKFIYRRSIILKSLKNINKGVKMWKQHMHKDLAKVFIRNLSVKYHLYYRIIYNFKTDNLYQ